MSSHTAIILPTLNEARNLPSLIPAIYAQLPEATVIVVDHHSADGSAEVALGMQERYPTLVVLRRTGRGLADAFRGAYEYVAAHGFLNAIQMDADGSHDPALLFAFTRISRQFDLIVGSRYLTIHGRRHCPWWRRGLSRCAQWYVRAWLRIPLSDITSGYRLLSRRLIEKLLAAELCSVGYAVQIEMAWVAAQHRMRMCEVPIEFLPRASGRSKLSWRVVAEALWRVPSLRVREARFGRAKEA